MVRLVCTAVPGCHGYPGKAGASGPPNPSRKSGITMDSPIPHYGPPVSLGSGADLRSNLAAGLRSLFFLAPRPGQWRPFPDQLVILLVIDVLLAVAFSLAQNGFEGEFRWDGVPRALFPLALGLFAGWVIGRRSGGASLWLTVATVVLATLCWLDLAMNVFVLGRDREWWAVDWVWGYPEYLLHGWWALTCAIAVSRAVGASAFLPRLANAGWTLVLVAVPLWWTPYTRLWVEPIEDAATAEAPAASREEVIYAQSRLLQSSAARLAPQRAGVEDLFFVGAAGYADEDVFLNEVSLAAEMIRTRYDADGHVLLLSNNPRTVRTLPLASATSLRQSLLAVSKTMDVEEDVLFLFLTTHGGEDHSLAMQFWPLQLADITPDTLRSMLDEAGIKWRVIVVSACYAGGFIAPLKDERTMIMTAADAFNKSFGCGADSELTFFGKAYFDEALRETHSFSAAFAKAKATIGEWEKANHYEPSNPDIHVGDEIRLKLDRIARRMASRIGGSRDKAVCAGDDSPGGLACGRGAATAN